MSERIISLSRETKWLVATLSIALFACLALILGRGLWLDEAYSVWFARHDIDLGEAMKTRWLRDGHPPLYPAYTWLLQPWFGTSVPSFRLINFGVLPIALATAALPNRTHNDNRFHLLFAALVATTPFFLLYAAELRSYFIQLVLSACLVAQIRMLLTRDEVSGFLWALLAATALVAINLHYVGSLVEFTLLGSAAVILFVEGRPRHAGMLVTIAALAAALLATSLALFLARTTPTQTNHIGAIRGAVQTALPLGAGVVSNLVAAAAAAPLLVRTVRSRAIDRFTWQLIIAIPAIAVVFTGYNLVVDNLVARFLIASVPLSSALIAHLLTRDGDSRRPIIIGICVAALATISATLVYGLANKRWATNAALIKAQQAACRDTRVVALSTLSALNPEDRLVHAVGTVPAFRLAYELVADAEGFTVQTAYRGRPVTAMHSHCPTLVWVEHRYIANVDNATLIRAAGLRSPTGRIAYRELDSTPERILLAAWPVRMLMQRVKEDHRSWTNRSQSES